MTSNAKVWLTTGSSSGLVVAFGSRKACSLVEAVLKKGEHSVKRSYRVVATARKPEQLDDLVQQYPETIHPVRLDVTNLQEIQAAIESALNQYDRIDVLVNNAGYPAMGAIEELSDEDIRRQFETNFFGTLNVTRAVLPTMREQRSGHILNIITVKD